MKKNIVIIHYNTPYLTECLVRSINLFVKDAIIYIFDNSDKLPFTAKFDNVTIFDNTNGQIINFDEWLKKYPKKHLSPGRVNKWGSAKHCYSVEKCMQLIKDNFILLDSDVLLKRDISDLFDEKSLYVGEVITQPRSTIKRILPFICFINTKMCLDKKIHYFNDNYMHGLAKKPGSDYYDTGAGFYIAASKFPHKDIKVEKYIVHYGNGSWNNKNKIIQYNETEWTNMHKSLWSDKKNKKVVYTCITGGYDNLIEPTYITNDFDYICFTDNLNMKSNVWQIRPLPEETNELNTIKKQRYVKINPHLLLSEYELSIWVDGNIEIKGDLNEFIKENANDTDCIFVPEHPVRNCIYSEEKAVLSLRKDVKENTSPQIDRYKKEGFPRKYGLLQSNILLRRHNENDCITIMEDWFEEIRNGSHRDQLSFNYVSWKHPYIHISYISKIIYRSKWFNWRKSHTKLKANRITNNIINKRTNILVEPPKQKKSIQELKKEFETLLNRKHKITTQQIGIYGV